MSILKQGSKIIRNLAGEILKEPLLIDISSDHGVTKDASNLVSSVKDKNQPVKFINKNSGCIENGDGLDFAANIGLGSLEGLPFNDITGDYFIGWWAKYSTTIPTGAKAVFGAYASGSPSVYCFINSGRMTIYPNGSNSATEDIRVVIDFTEWNYFSIEKVNNTIHFCKNGYYSDSKTSTYGLQCNENKLQLANLGGVNSFSVSTFKLDDYTVRNASNHNYVNKAYTTLIFVPPKRSSE